jgi:hypothetical protein
MSTRLNHAVFNPLDRETVAVLDAAKLNLDTIATASTASVFSVSGFSRDQAQSQLTLIDKLWGERFCQEVAHRMGQDFGCHANKEAGEGT